MMGMDKPGMYPVFCMQPGLILAPFNLRSALYGQANNETPPAQLV